MNAPVRILGIDPGSRLTGYGVVETTGDRIVWVQHGAIRTNGDDFPSRLAQIYAGIGEVLETWQPQEVAIERVFVHRNADSALKLGHARSAAICATFAHTISLYEYAPRAVKQAVTGLGGADKEQVARMVGMLLGLKGELQADAADALAIAICHSNSRRLNTRVAGAGR
ncbi:MAG TPA: crossover junction endodeoxyribonuclease RuvC [Woeseiaceae bacterium]|nr:crossover junction endodeoxyribonuclease RuvC [Woeseiaceae bacterium]